MEKREAIPKSQMTMNEEQIHKKIVHELHFLAGYFDMSSNDEKVHRAFNLQAHRLINVVKQAQYEYGLELIGEDEKSYSPQFVALKGGHDWNANIRNEFRDELRQRNEERRG